MFLPSVAIQYMEKWTGRGSTTSATCKHLATTSLRAATGNCIQRKTIINATATAAMNGRTSRQQL